MGLVTDEYYTQTYLGEPVHEMDFPRYEARAEDLILGLINKSAADILAITSQSVQEAVKKAICCQIEYFFEYGLNVAVAGREGGGGFTVGKVSVNNGSSSAAASGSRSMIAPGVYVYLERTGLLYPGVPTVGTPPQVWGWWM